MALRIQGAIKGSYWISIATCTNVMMNNGTQIPGYIAGRRIKGKWSTVLYIHPSSVFGANQSICITIHSNLMPPPPPPLGFPCLVDGGLHTLTAYMYFDHHGSVGRQLIATLTHYCMCGHLFHICFHILYVWSSVICFHIRYVWSYVTYMFPSTVCVVICYICNELGGNMARSTQFPIMITRSTIIYEIVSPDAAGSSIYI